MVHIFILVSPSSRVVCILVLPRTSSSSKCSCHAVGVGTKGGTIWEGGGRVRASSSGPDMDLVQMKLLVAW